MEVRAEFSIVAKRENYVFSNTTRPLKLARPILAYANVLVSVYMLANKVEEIAV